MAVLRFKQPDLSRYETSLVTKIRSSLSVIASVASVLRQLHPLHAATVDFDL